MAISVKMQARQSQSLNQGLGQSLTMTPQLVQSIKLLQMSSAELLKHVEEEIEKNPLLELADGEAPSREDGSNARVEVEEPSLEVNLDLDTSQTALEKKLDTTFENEFDRDISGGESIQRGDAKGSALTGTDFSAGYHEGSDIGEYVAERKNLRDHLNEQLSLTKAEPTIRLAAAEIIDALDEDGYLRTKLHEIAVERRLGADDLEAGLKIVQGFEPIGIGARSLGECLSLQLVEKNHFDPAIATLIENLDLLAKRDFDGLVALCKVSLDDVLDMVDEIKSLDPRPARSFDTAPVQSITPDVLVKENSDGSFSIELNSDALPKVLINQSYEAIVSTKNQKQEEKTFMSDCLQSANWLVRSLEQRANTILKVMAEIVRRQDSFFAFGISHLKPMSLQQVADEIGMHESTISRVTSNKYVLTNRGVFELKFFFTAAISGTDGGESHSAEAVRQRIKHLVANEETKRILSDDALVELLKEEGIDIARRTVAKYRESLHIASSVQRRREKRATANRD